MCAKFKVGSFKPFLCWSPSSVCHPQTFPQRNSSNHENCNIEFPLNTLSDQICQISFGIFDVKKSILKQKSKYLNSIRVFHSFHFMFLLKWNKQEIFEKRNEKYQKQSPQHATVKCSAGLQHGISPPVLFSKVFPKY